MHRPAKRKTGKWKIAAFGAGGIAVLGVLAACAIVVWTRSVLGSGKVRDWVDDDPEKLYLEYASASSFWPGRVRLHGFRLRGRDPNVEWEVRIEDCGVRISLPDLLRKKFHAVSVDAQGLTFRLRQRILPGSDAVKRAEFLPPIEGFPPVPVRGRPPTGPTEDAGDLWGVQIDRLSAAPVKEIWIDTYRYEGSASLTGRLFLQPRRQASVGPAHLEWREGTLSLFGKRAVSPVSASVDCRILAFDPETVRGSDVWDYLSARADWRGQLAGLEFLNPLLGSEPKLSGGKGEMSGHIFMDHGKGDARIALTADGSAARYSKDTLEGNVSAELRMSSWRPANGVAETAGSSISLRDIGSVPSGGRAWWGRFGMGPSRLASVSGGLRLAGRATSRCRDARPLYTMFGVGLPKWTRGLMSLEDFAATATVDFAPRLLRVDGLEARGGHFQIRGRYARVGDAKEGALLISDPPLEVGVGIDGTSTRIKAFGASKWFEGESRKK